MDSLKIAVIGSGAAAMGVLAGIARTRPESHVTLFEIGEIPVSPLESSLPPDQWPPNRLAEIYRHLRRENGFSILQPKSRFGALIPRYRVGERARAWQSVHRGGLTNFWGATMLPFTAAELDGWPITADDLRPYYREIADRVGVSGAADGLDAYFPDAFENRPPLQPLPGIARMAERLQTDRPANGYRFVAGLNRAAIETRDDDPQRCVYCGQCMVGCFAGAIYTAKTAIDSHEAEGLLQTVVRDKVLTVDPDGGRLRTAGGHEGGPFDRIYLAAGCIGTTEILMRSLDIREGPIIVDNAVHTFALINRERATEPFDPSRYLALTNGLVLALAEPSGRCTAQIQVYPTMDHLWMPLAPPLFWPLCRRIAAHLRDRVYWGRAYLDGAVSPKYAMSLHANGMIHLDLLEESDTQAEVKIILTALKTALRGAGLAIPAFKTIKQSTSSHYGCTVPYGGKLVPLGRDGRIGRTVYVCDSSCFPTLPAVSPTFTIMANAMRTATLSLTGAA